MSAHENNLILIELNEINFDIVKKYLPDKKLQALANLFKGFNCNTEAEMEYENLEPWIQWPSVHSGLTAIEHKIFRLGDVVNADIPQIFEKLEEKGLKVGCISAMNAVNRLKNPSYFIPDPWTKTSSDSSWWSRKLTPAIAQTINDNSQSKITLKSAFYLGLALIRFSQFKNLSTYFSLILKSMNAPWRKALIFDLLLHDIHLNFFKNKKPDFSTVFFNAGAHIQHHYFYNIKNISSENKNPEWYVKTSEDPFHEMLMIYNRILSDYLNIKGVEWIVATGLSQKIFEEKDFYYRLKNHELFLNKLKINYKNVHPRMTRDFLVEFDNEDECSAACAKLSALKSKLNHNKIFDQVDNRGSSLFVTLTYNKEITEDFEMTDGLNVMKLFDAVTFVAIKNGMHQSRGFLFASSGVEKFVDTNFGHVKNIYYVIDAYFNKIVV